MSKQSLEKIFLTLLTGALSLTACVDDSYNLSDLNTTIQVGSSGTLTLPSSSTGDIVLKNIFDLTKDGPITTLTVDGQELYFLDKDGEASPDPIKIQDIVINKPADQTINATLDLRGVLGGVKAQSPQKAPVTRDYQYDISDLAKAELKNARATGISADVVDIKRISFTETQATLRLTVSGQNSEVIRKLHFDDLALHLPTGLEITSCTYLGQEKLGTEALRTKATEQGLITIIDGEDTEGYAISSEPLTFTIILKAAQVGNGSGIQFDGAAHTAELSGQFQLTGTAGLSNNAEDINYEVLYDKFMVIINEWSYADKVAALAKLALGDYSQAIDLLLPHTLNFAGTCRFDKNITVETFSGHVQHALDHIDDIKLDNLPDFLEGDDVVLDLANPQLYLDIFTELATTFNTNITLVPFRKNVQTATGVSADITYDGTLGKHKALMLAMNPEVLEFPAAYTGSNYVQEKQAGKDVGSLIRKIPDYIKVQGTGSNSSIIIDMPACEDVRINRSYDVSLQYRVYSALTFGNDFQIVYRDTEEDFNLGDDVKDLSVENVQLEAAAVSDVPLALNLIVKPLDKNGNIINNLQVLYKNSGESSFGSGGVKIRAGANASAQDKFAILLQGTNGHQLSEFLQPGSQQLDGIKYEAVLNEPSSNADALKTTSRVQLKDIKVSVTGVSYISKDEKDK